MAFRLSIEDGSYLQTLQVERERLKVGRDAANDLRLQSANVSGRHCTIRQNGNTLVVTDLHSKTGLVQRGRRHERLVLKSGDSVEIGDAVLTLVHIDGVAPPPEKPAPPLGSSLPKRPAAAPAAAAAATAAVASPPRTARKATTASRKAAAGTTSPARGTRTAAPVSARPTSRAAAVQQELEFSDLVYQGWRQTPWWMLSVTAHALLLLTLTFVDFSPGEAYRDIDANVGVSVNDHGELDDSPEPSDDPYDQDNPLENMERPEEELRPRDIEKPIPETEDDEPLVVHDDKPFMAPSSQDTPDRGEQVVGVSAAALGGGFMGAEFGKDGAAMANRKAAGAIEANPFSRALLRGLRVKSTRDNVRIVRGQYDRCENVFATLRLNHGTITLDELASGMPDSKVKAILINCSGETLPPRARRNLRAWVNQGGWLFTTDWALERVIHTCFRGYIAPLTRNKKAVLTNDETVSVKVNSRHPLLKGVPEGKQETRWWLEDSSYPFQVIDKERVEVLVTSEEMQERWKSKNIAATFPFGEGRVVHVVGHLFQREGNLRGAYGMQRLLLNFLYQAINKR